MRIILDTNIWVSGLISKSGAPAKIVNAVLVGTLIAVMSERTFAELEEVLGRPKFKRYFDRANIAPSDFLLQLRKITVFVKPRRTKNTVIRDPKDLIFVELARSRSAAAFIVTGDADFTERRYGNAKVISASEFVDTVLHPPITTQRR